MIPAAKESGAKTKIAMHATPGLNKKVEAGNGGGRSNFEKFGAAVYGVVGDKFVCIDVNYSVTEIGTIATSAGRVVMAAGRTYIAAADGTNMYHYNGTVMGTVTSTSAPSNTTHVKYMDGYFIGNDSTSDEWAISSLEDPTTWSAVDRANAEKRADNITAIETKGSQLYLLGPESTEVWRNTGNADFPYIRYPNGVLEDGVHAPYSVARSKFGIVYYSTTIEGDGQILIVNGIQSKTISTESLQWEIRTFAENTDAFAFCYAQAGRTFYQITFPSADRTYCIDLESGFWFRKKSLTIGRHKVAGHGYLGGQHIVSDYANTNIYKLDLDYFKDGDDLINRERVTQVLHKDRRRIQIHALEVEVEAGTATGTDEGFLLLRYSKNGGKSWSTWMARSMGKIGEYGKRTIWRSFPEGRDWVFHIKCSVNAPFNLVGAYADLEVLRD